VIIRTGVGDISLLGRSTSGVKVMNVTKNVHVASIAKVRKDESEEEEETTEDTDNLE
jgi:DNA gyrase subunit A